MAQGIAEEIFRLKADTDSIIKGLQQVKGVYTELTQEQIKQAAELTILEQKEKQLLEARNKSANPSTIIRYNKEINETVKQIGALKEATDKLGASNLRAKQEIDAVSIATKNAFNGTQVNAVKSAATQFNALGNSVNQISRELPAFAVSANVGFLAISNNLPIFFDALEKVKKENAALAAQGQKTTSVMSQLGSAIFSTGSILSIGVTLLTIYGKAIVDWTIALFEGEKALESLKTANEEFNKSIVKTSAEIVDLTIKLKVQRGELTKTEGELLRNENARTAALNANKELRKKSIDALKEELGVTNDLLALEGKKRTVINDGIIEETDILTSNEKAKIARYKNEVARINDSYGLENSKINEKFNLQGKLEKEDQTIHKAKKERIKEIIDLSDRIRQLGIDDIKEQQKQEIEQAKFDTDRAIRDLGKINASEAQKKELTLALKNDLINKLEAIDKKYLDKRTEEAVAEAERTGAAMNSELEDNANTEIFINEKKIKKLESQGKKADKDELKRLKDLNNQKKFELLDFEQTVELSGLKQNEQGQVNEAERDAILTKYANKRKKLQAEIDDSVKTSTTTAREEMLKQIGYFQGLEKAIIDALQKMIAMKIAETDNYIAQQEKRIAATKEIADRGNAQVLELEQKRLDELNKKRENYVRQQQGLAALELIANTAVAVSKAASQTGVAAGVGIAAALIALVAGLASARSIASQAAFYEGGYTGDGNPREESGAVGKRPYIYHKAEFVMDHKKTRQFRDIFEDIHGGKVDLKEWKQKVHLFDSLGGMQMFMNKAPYQASPQVNNIIQLKSLEGKFDDLNNTFKSLRLGLNVDENGFTTFMQKHISRDNHIKQMAKL